MEFIPETDLDEYFLVSSDDEVNDDISSGSDDDDVEQMDLDKPSESEDEIEPSVNEEGAAEKQDEGENQVQSTGKEDTSSGEEADSENEYENQGNVGMADMLSKILRTKKPKNKKTIVLSKARKLSSIKPVVKSQEDKIEIVGASGDTVEEPTPVKDGKDELQKKMLSKYKTSRKEFYNRGRMYPHQRDQKKERELKKLATRAVVELFNSVSRQQNVLNTRLNAAGNSIIKKDKVMKEIVKNKKSFLDVIVNSGINQTAEEDREIKSEDEDEDEDNAPSNNWSVLRQDFMQSANLKDWDKED